MSTLAFAALTTRREEATPGTSTSTAPPGVQSYVDALAALVPAEVLTLHGIILSVTTKTQTPATTITEPQTLYWAFFGLLLLATALYVVPRFKRWDRLDYVRMFIPPVAFVAWTMLQRATAFDAVCPSLGDASRTVIAVFVAAFLAFVAAVLANKADQKQP